MFCRHDGENPNRMGPITPPVNVTLILNPAVGRLRVDQGIAPSFGYFSQSQLYYTLVLDFQALELRPNWAFILMADYSP